MSAFKQPKIGRYQAKDRKLQKSLSYEKTSLTWHPINVYRYLGTADNGEGSTIFDIQDDLFLENTDRRYDPNPVLINAGIEEQNENPFDLSKFGIINPIGDTQLFRVHVNSFEADGMGRYLVAGDVIEVPFFQENGNAGKKAFFEVTDVDRKMEFENFYVTVTTTPVKDSQEMQEIDGIPTNSDILTDLQTTLDEAYEAAVDEHGVSTEPYIYVDRGYVVDDYVDPISDVPDSGENRDAYDPRRGSDFLDNPDALIF